MIPQMQMVIAGTCLATWQIFAGLSGLPGPVANMWVLVLSALVAVVTAVGLTSWGNLGILGGLTAILFFAVVVVFRHVVPVAITPYLFGAIAGLLSGVAVWQLNDVLSTASKSEIGALLVMMMAAQIATAATYDIAAKLLVGSFSFRTLAAIFLTLIAGYLLHVK